MQGKGGTVQGGTLKYSLQCIGRVRCTCRGFLQVQRRPPFFASSGSSTRKCVFPLPVQTRSLRFQAFFKTICPLYLGKAPPHAPLTWQDAVAQGQTPQNRLVLQEPEGVQLLR